MADAMMRNFFRWATFAVALPRPFKQGVVLALDVLLCMLAVWLAFYLRLGYFVSLSGTAMWPVLVSVAVALPIFITSGLYRAIFRYSGMPAMLAVARAMLLYGLVFSVVFTFWGIEGVPRTLGLIQPLLLLLFLGASRATARIWLSDLYHKQFRNTFLRQALLYGAGNAGGQLASAMANSNEIRVVGFLDDDDRLHGHLLNGLPIHNPADLAKILSVSPITDVLMTLPSVSRQRRNEILNRLRAHKVAVRTLPNLSDITTGKVSLSDVRELDIHDLLCREPVQPDDLLLNANTHHKTVLVTGAGGSIGGELCRQILKTNPMQLLLVEISEFALYQIYQELVSLLADTKTIHIQAQGEPAFEPNKALQVASIELVPLLASVCDDVRMHEIMDTWKPHTVYHAAAYKHVPLVEHNSAEGVRNNVWGTWVCAAAAARNGVRNFVLISTDKAVRPTSIMGATKRLAEMVLQALTEAQSKSSTTTFSIVRFGNVLDSSGSVVPLFREQIKNGGPITLTHPDITRYFMTITEAAQLVIQAGAMGQGGDVFVLDMGRSVRIIDLARRMVELSGLTVRDEANLSGDIELAVTGLRPGEKLYEELLIGGNPQATQHPHIMKANEKFLSWLRLEEELNALSIAMSKNNVPVIRAQLQQLVSGYQPSGAVVDWVYMAQEQMAKEHKALANEKAVRETSPLAILTNVRR